MDCLLCYFCAVCAIAGGAVRRGSMFLYVDQKGNILETDHHCARCGFKQATINGVHGYENSFLCEKCALQIWSEENRKRDAKRLSRQKYLFLILFFLLILSILKILFDLDAIR